MNSIDSDYEIIEEIELQEINNEENLTKVLNEKKLNRKKERKKEEILLNELDEISEPENFDDFIKKNQIIFEIRFLDFSFKIILHNDSIQHFYKISKILSILFDDYSCIISKL